MSTVDRRTLLRTAAWTVPVVAVAAAVPALAASGETTATCNVDYVITDEGGFARLTNPFPAETTFSFSHSTPIPVATLTVTSSSGSQINFNPLLADSYTWPHVFPPNGEQVTYSGTPLSGTYTVTVPAGGSLDFSSKAFLAEGCVPDSVRASIIATPCEVGYTIDCFPF